MIKKTRPESEEINSSSMADIAFLLLVFFLVTTTISMDKGISLVLPPVGEELEVNPKNITNILINESGKVLMDEKPVNVRDIARLAQEKIGRNDKIIFSVQTHSRTRYKDYIKVTSYLDEPISNLNFLNTYWQTKLAKENGIKVVLTGDGADELFCGYDRYKSAYLAPKLKFLNFFSKKINRINQLKSDEIPLYYYSIFKNNEHKKIFNLQDLNENDDFSSDIYEDFSSTDKIDYINYFDTRYWLTNESNYKLDKCSMINSVEARVPFQDINLINRFFFISNKLKFKLHNRKYILKNMNILPRYILKRPKTGWFSPEKIFLETHLTNIIKDYFSEDKIRSQNLFNIEEIFNFFKRFPIENYKIKRHTLTIILFQIWYDRILNLK